MGAGACVLLTWSPLRLWMLWGRSTWVRSRLGLSRVPPASLGDPCPPGSPPLPSRSRLGVPALPGSICPFLLRPVRPGFSVLLPGSAPPPRPRCCRGPQACAGSWAGIPTQGVPPKACLGGHPDPGLGVLPPPSGLLRLGPGELQALSVLRLAAGARPEWPGLFPAPLRAPASAPGPGRLGSPALPSSRLSATLTPALCPLATPAAAPAGTPAAPHLVPTGVSCLHLRGPSWLL